MLNLLRLIKADNTQKALISTIYLHLYVNFKVFLKKIFKKKKEKRN